ncbi:MAG: anti-sigma factor [Gammaproteobacteria bacterium]|nr:anti-sigma factor [Gammaproteobacteria bacterium]MDE2262943.1 anti-sigma factor [Gammaproteobacteria bacterium]
MSAGDCGKLLLLQAEIDGELDAAEAAALAEHRAGCPVCKRNEALLLAARQALRGATYHRAGPELLRAVATRIGAGGAAPQRRRTAVPWQGLIGFGAGAALAAAIVLTLLPFGRPQLVAALVDDHVRALQPGHLLDVVSTNQHTVKPWFDGRLDFAPPVKDLASSGFPLLGGRLDYVHGRSVAVLVYSRGKHLIELFVWPAKGTAGQPARSARDGYNIVHWTADGMSLSAVSDLEPAGLDQFAREWRQTP